MSGLRRSDKAAMAAGLAGLAMLAVALRPQHTPMAGPESPAAVAIDRPAPPAVNRPTALIIGDNYTSGSGLAEISYDCQAAQRMGWLCVQASEPGTGYISGGDANRFTIDKTTQRQSTSFGERMPGLGPKYQPDVVILDGGRSDTFVPGDRLFDVMRATLWQVRATWPNARVVLVRPRLLSKPDDDLGFDDDFIGRLGGAAGIDDLIVVDPILRFKDSGTHGLIAADGRDPSLDGEHALGAALADALTQSGFVPAT